MPALSSSRFLMRRWRAALTLWLVAALLWAPVWGQWHGIAHQVRQGVSSPVVLPAAGDSDDGHVQGSALCQVLDHLGHASALMGWPLQAALLWLPAPSPVWLGLSTVDMRPCWTTQARAPPNPT